MVGYNELYGYAYSLGMLKVSIIMRKLYSALVSCIRLKSKTLELKVKIIVICMIYFANMCYLYLVAGVYRE